MPIEYTVELPGGILLNGKLRRNATFKPLTGYIEQRIEEIRSSESNAAFYVTRVLMVSLQRVGDESPDYELLNSLSVADRQYLMLHLAAMLEGRYIWLQPKCSNCSATYDVQINRQELPVVRATGSYPYTVAIIGNNEVKLRLPQGKDQVSLLQFDTDKAINILIRNCVETVDRQRPDEDFFNSLTWSDIETIESALDDISPAICTMVSTVCPECASREEIHLNPYLLSRQTDEALLSDIHYIASHYHWSEDAILSLPRARRQNYLRYIDAQHGIYT